MLPCRHAHQWLVVPIILPPGLLGLCFDDAGPVGALLVLWSTNWKVEARSLNFYNKRRQTEDGQDRQGKLYCGKCRIQEELDQHWGKSCMSHATTRGCNAEYNIYTGNILTCLVALIGIETVSTTVHMQLDVQGLKYKMIERHAEDIKSQNMSV